MKKKIVKLNLSCETLGLLSAQDVNRAAGGVRTFGAGTCGINCSEQDTCLSCNTCFTCKYSCPGQTCDCPY